VECNLRERARAQVFFCIVLQIEFAQTIQRATETDVRKHERCREIAMVVKICDELVVGQPEEGLAYSAFRQQAHYRGKPFVGDFAVAEPCCPADAKGEADEPLAGHGAYASIDNPVPLGICRTADVNLKHDFSIANVRSHRQAE
jgi:hypothetical protein